MMRLVSIPSLSVCRPAQAGGCDQADLNRLDHLSRAVRAEGEHVGRCSAYTPAQRQQGLAGSVCAAWCGARRLAATTGGMSPVGRVSGRAGVAVPVVRFEREGGAGDRMS